MFEDIYNHNYYENDGCGQYECCDSNNNVGFKCLCGKVFDISLDEVVKSNYCDLLGNDDSRKKIAEMLYEGYIGSSEQLKDDFGEWMWINHQE